MIFAKSENFCTSRKKKHENTKKQKSKKIRKITQKSEKCKKYKNVWLIASVSVWQLFQSFLFGFFFWICCWIYFAVKSWSKSWKIVQIDTTLIFYRFCYGLELFVDQTLYWSPMCTECWWFGRLCKSIDFWTSDLHWATK